MFEELQRALVESGSTEAKAKKTRSESEATGRAFSANSIISWSSIENRWKAAVKRISLWPRRAKKGKKTSGPGSGVDFCARRCSARCRPKARSRCNEARYIRRGRPRRGGRTAAAAGEALPPDGSGGWVEGKGLSSKPDQSLDKWVFTYIEL